MIAASSFMIAQPANAAYQAFWKVPVSTFSEDECLSWAGDAARDLGFANVLSGPSFVAGEFGGAWVSMTCVGNSDQPATAIVMSVADDSFEDAKQAAGPVVGRLKKMHALPRL